MKVVITGNKHGLPMCCYVSLTGCLTYDRSRAFVFKSEQDAAADLEYFRKERSGYHFETEPYRLRRIGGAS